MEIALSDDTFYHQVLVSNLLKIDMTYCFLLNYFKILSLSDAKKRGVCDFFLLTKMRNNFCHLKNIAPHFWCTVCEAD